MEFVPPKTMILRANSWGGEEGSKGRGRGVDCHSTLQRLHNDTLVSGSYSGKLNTLHVEYVHPHGHHRRLGYFTASCQGFIASVPGP